MSETNVRELIQLALAGLPRMQLPSGLFCLEVVDGASAPRGRSVRYTLMVYIGLLRADAAGYRHDFDLERIREALLRSIDAPELRIGDLGLYLWADALTEGRRSDDLLRRLTSALGAKGGLASRDGMEVAWVVQGLALAGNHHDSDQRARLLSDALGLLLRANPAANGLFYHSSTGRVRRRFPTFATEIYGVLALATVAKLGLADEAAAVARGAADRLIALQLADGGWPWLYDATTGRVVERYGIYSVHQHAMAPMALLELAEATGDRGYADAAVRGLDWIHGRNELARDMVDPVQGIIYRSLRRPRGRGRFYLYANMAGAAAFGSSPASAGQVELNATCRPYELGWLLEAWCGREGAASTPSPR